MCLLSSLLYRPSLDRYPDLYGVGVVVARLLDLLQGSIPHICTEDQAVLQVDPHWSTDFW